MQTKTAPRWLLFMLLVLESCVSAPEFTEVQDVMGYVPVYGDEIPTVLSLSSERPVEDPGKIYVYGNYLLVNEIRQGIHVFDNSDPSQPQPVGFLELPGN